jgi:hypothetical protein
MTALRTPDALGRTQAPVEGNAFDRGWLVRAGGGCCSSDGVWPNVDQARPARGGSGAPRRGPCRSKVDPRLLPPTSEPRLATALLGEPWRGLGQGHPPV